MVDYKNLYFKNKRSFINNLLKKQGDYLNEYFANYLRLLTEDDNDENEEKHIKESKRTFWFMNGCYTDGMYYIIVRVPLCFLNKITNVKYYMFFYRKDFFEV